MTLDAFTLGFMFISGVAIAPLVIKVIKFITRAIPIVAKWLAIAIMALIWIVGFCQVILWLVKTT